MKRLNDRLTPRSLLPQALNPARCPRAPAISCQPRWQIAVENLINAAESGGGWLMFARIGVMRALNGDGTDIAGYGR